MGDKTGIEWTDATWNPLRGCSRVSEGCRHCYAETVAARFSDPGQPYHGVADRTRSGSKWTGKVVFVEKMLGQPLRWKRPRRIFVNSMSDLFHESVPDEWIDQIFAVMALSPQHTFQVLTKRPERMLAWFNEKWQGAAAFPEMGIAAGAPTDRSYQVEQAMMELARERGMVDSENEAHWTAEGESVVQMRFQWPLPNVWIGVSVENQAAADERIPLLLDTPAAKRFLSCEPLLGPVNLDGIQAPRYVPEDHETDWKFSCLDTGAYYWYDCSDGISDCGDGPMRDNKIDWVIVGGESGREARPMRLQWARDIRDRCAASDVPLFFKQWGEWLPDNFCGDLVDFDQDCPGPEIHGYAYDEDADCWRVGKKKAGALLDGVEHKAFPV